MHLSNNVFVKFNRFPVNFGSKNKPEGSSTVQNHNISNEDKKSSTGKVIAIGAAILLPVVAGVDFVINKILDKVLDKNATKGIDKLEADAKKLKIKKIKFPKL